MGVGCLKVLVILCPKYSRFMAKNQSQNSLKKAGRLDLLTHSPIERVDEVGEF